MFPLHHSAHYPAQHISVGSLGVAVHRDTGEQSLGRGWRLSAGGGGGAAEV